MEYILYCDESCQEGSLVSDFFGGCLVSAKDYLMITNQLNAEKLNLNLYGEIKWTKVTENYLSKYTEMMNLFFSFIKDGKLKIRIMFRNNCDEQENHDTLSFTERYYNHYLRFIMYAFGLKHLKYENEQIYLRIYLDTLPTKSKKNEKFKQALLHIPESEDFSHSSIAIREGDIAEVKSHDHAILQCLDVVLGAMYYKMNKLNLVVSEDGTNRGKRTIAKETLFKHIFRHIKVIFPGFEISETTPLQDDNELSYWEHPYRHWQYLPD